MAIPAGGRVDIPRPTGAEGTGLMKQWLDSPNLVKSAARAAEPHRVAYWLTELAGGFHPYYKNHRGVPGDPTLMLPRLPPSTAGGQGVANGPPPLGGGAPAAGETAARGRRPSGPPRPP